MTTFMEFMQHVHLKHKPTGDSPEFLMFLLQGAVRLYKLIKTQWLWQCGHLRFLFMQMCCLGILEGCVRCLEMSKGDAMRQREQDRDREDRQQDKATTRDREGQTVR